MVDSYSALKIHPAGSLLIAMYGATIGRMAILDVAATSNQACCALSRPNNVDVRFVFYGLQAGRQRLLLDASGGGQPNINQDKVRSYKLLMPPFDEQRAIADFLDRETARIDTLIEEQQRLVEMLRAGRIDLIRNAVLGDINPFAPRSDVSLTAIAHHFSVTLGKMLDSGRNSREGDEDLPYVRAGNIQDSGLRLSDVNTMSFSVKEAEELNLIAGDLLVAEGGAVGTSVLLLTDMPGWSFQKTVNRIRATRGWSTAWLAYVIRTYRDIGAIDIVCNRSTIAHLTAEKLRALRVPNVDPMEQRRIVAYLDAQTSKIDTLIAETEKFIELARERRSALISAAVSGQFDIEVKVDR